MAAGEIIQVSPFLSQSIHCVKLSKYGVFSGPYFSAFGLNTEREKCPNKEFFLVRIFRMEFGHFSRSDQVDYMIKIFEK